MAAPYRATQTPLRLMAMTTGFHWRPTTEERIFLTDRARAPNEEIKKEKKRIREIVIRFPVCRPPDMTDRKQFHLFDTFTFVRPILARVEFHGGYTTHLPRCLSLAEISERRARASAPRSERLLLRLRFSQLKSFSYASRPSRVFDFPQKRLR